jgi:hypothetical protein
LRSPYKYLFFVASLASQRGLTPATHFGFSIFPLEADPLKAGDFGLFKPMKNRFLVVIGVPNGQGTIGPFCAGDIAPAYIRTRM